MFELEVCRVQTMKARDMKVNFGPPCRHAVLGQALQQFGAGLLFLHQTAHICRINATALP